MSHSKTPEDAMIAEMLRESRQNGSVIECEDVTGVTHSFAFTGVQGLFAARIDTPDGDSTSWLVDPDIENTISRVIVNCTPDVRLVPESESRFTGETNE